MSDAELVGRRIGLEVRAPSAPTFPNAPTFPSVPELVHRLLAAGRLDADGVLDGRVRVTDEQRVSVVRLDGRPVAVAKRPATGAERAVLPHVAGVGPRLISGIDGGDVLWTEPLGLAPLRTGTALPPVAALRALGAVLARLHAVPAAGVRPAPRPWVLDSPPRMPDVLEGNTAALHVFDIVLAAPSVSAAVARAGMAWRPTAVVHGDATLDNTVGAAAGSGRGWSVRLIDFGLAGLGAAAWDVVAAVDSIETSGLLAGVDTSLAVSELLAGYRPKRPLWTSWRPFRVARAVQSAVAVAARDGLSEGVDALVSRALGLACRDLDGQR